MNRYTKVRELVKDPSLTIKDIAQQTGYNKGHVSRLRKEAMRQELCREEIMIENKNAKTPADGPEYERGFVDGMQRQMQLHVNRVIKTWHERCEEHPDHQTGMISERMIQERMQEEIDELRQALETDLARVGEVGVWGEWVGLTDDEVSEAIDDVLEGGGWLDVSRAIEAKLREKNHG